MGYSRSNQDGWYEVYLGSVGFRRSLVSLFAFPACLVFMLAVRKLHETSYKNMRQHLLEQSIALLSCYRKDVSEPASGARVGDTTMLVLRLCYWTM